MALVKRIEFLGRVKISQNTKETSDLESYIDDNQREYLTELLGAAEYNNLIADLVADVPQTQKWIDFINGVTWQDSDDITYNYTGIKQMLRLFTFWDYVRNQGAKHTTIGVRIADSENATNPDRQYINVETSQRYNDGVELYHAAKAWLAEFKEQTFIYDSTTEPVGGTYEFNVTELGLYLEVGDTVTVEGNEFTVTILPAGPLPDTLTCSGTAGITFASQDGTGTYEPFADLITTDIKYMVYDGMY